MDFYHSPVAVWVNSAPQPKRWGPRAHRGRILWETFEVRVCNWLNSSWDRLIKATFKSTILELCLQMTIKTRQIWGIWKLRPAYSPETPNLGQNRWCFVPCDLEIWWMTLENNRAPLLCCFKLCATFHSHRWIQTGVAVQKRPIWVKLDDF